MSRRHRSTIEDVLELFRDNIVDVDSVEEYAILTRNTLTITAFAIAMGAFVNVFIAISFFAK